MDNGKNLIHSFQGETIENFNGLTKREYFAALAMQGLLSNKSITILDMDNAKIIIGASIGLADELIKQL
jgi:hypothetical protein